MRRPVAPCLPLFLTLSLPGVALAQAPATTVPTRPDSGRRPVVPGSARTGARRGTRRKPRAGGMRPTTTSSGAA